MASGFMSGSLSNTNDGNAPFLPSCLYTPSSALPVPPVHETPKSKLWSASMLP